MTAPEQGPGEQPKALPGNWATCSAIGSFALYLLGYLALRFHLTVLGIGTDLVVLDERYLFAGAKFLVYLVMSVPIVVLVALVLGTPMYLLGRLWLGPLRTEAGDVSASWQRLGGWWSVPGRASLIGIVVAVVLIQFVMRQCFLFSNLLLEQELPPPVGLQAVLLDTSGGLASLYMAGLLLGIALTGGLCWVARRGIGHTRWSRCLVRLLAFLVAVQLLLLPVNYGILIVDKTMPRVVDLGNQEPLEESQQAWLIWEGKDGVTYLVRNQTGGQHARQLITLPREAIKRIALTAYDPILRLLFRSESPASKRERKSS